jgi:HEPN domain
MKRETKEWIRKAEMDWESALDLSAAAFRSHKVFHDTICFHRQQTAEKYLKALVCRAMPFRSSQSSKSSTFLRVRRSPVRGTLGSFRLGPTVRGRLARLAGE